MTKRIIGWAMILFIGMILSACNIFTSEDLDNHTAKDAMTSFLKAAFDEDEDMVDELATFDEDEQKDFIKQAENENLADIDMDACAINDTGDPTYAAICENDDGEDVHIVMSLDEEDDDEYFIESVSMDPAVDFTFRQDDSELTDDYVEELEEMINADFPMLDDDEKEQMAFQSYDFADLLVNLFDDDEPIKDRIDMDKFVSSYDDFNDEQEVVDFIKENLDDMSDDLIVTEIEFGSFYDNLTYHDIHNEADYESAKNYVPVPMDEEHEISFTLEDENEETQYFSGRFYMKDDQLKFFKFFVYHESTFEYETYDLEQEDEDESDDLAGDVTMDDGEEVYMNNCASCHADDLSGSVGPDLTEVYDKYDKEELMDIVIEGTGDMPPGIIVDDKEAEVLSEWLLELEEE